MTTAAQTPASMARHRARRTPALFPTGEILGRFRIDGVLGIGGTGTVFRAHDEDKARDVAVKAIPHDAVLRQRARREVAVAGRLDHPHVVRLYEVLEDDDYVYVISELVDGSDLAGAVRDGALSDATILRIAAAVCEALAHAHSRGIVHRDVKPANVLLGGDGAVRLADFGIAAISEPEATVDDRLLGTLSYMAPEACAGEPPAAPNDVWAVGVLLYECLTGANPFRARTPAELWERHGEGARPLAEIRPDLPRTLSAVIARALSPTPRRRPSAPALAAALEQAADRLEAPMGGLVHLRPPDDEPGVDVRDLAIRTGEHARALANRALAAGIPEPSFRRAEAIARRLGPGVLAGLAVGATLTAFPFWPPSWIWPMAFGIGALAVAWPWAGAALGLAAIIPAMGNVSAGLAWTVSAAGAAWLVTCAGAGRRALLPVLAPVLAALLAWPAYLMLAGRLRAPAARALAGAAGALAVALWQAGPSDAHMLNGVGDAARVADALRHGLDGPVLVLALAWGCAAALWPLAWNPPRGSRALAVSAWLSAVCLAQALGPALAGGSAGAPWAILGAIWMAGIVLLLAVPAPPLEREP
jgi:hypothetical protein